MAQAREMSAEELQMIREYRRQASRRFWQSMTPDERRAKRRLYDLNAAKKRAECERSEKYSLMKRKRGNEK